MNTKHPLWIPNGEGTQKRYNRDSAGKYNMRHLMEPAPPGTAMRRKWVLFKGDKRVWEVPACTLLSAAIGAAEDWIARS